MKWTTENAASVVRFPDSILFCPHVPALKCWVTFSRPSHGLNLFASQVTPAPKLGHFHSSASQTAVGVLLDTKSLLREIALTLKRKERTVGALY